MKIPYSNGILGAAVLALLSGCPAPAQPSKYEVVPLETIYADSFTTNPYETDWKTWQSDQNLNKLFARHDTAEGGGEPGSLRLRDTMGGLWQKIIPIEEGGLYRLVASVRTDDPGRSEFGVAVRPCDSRQKFTHAFNEFVAQDLEAAKSGDWTRREVLWVVPASGAINGEKLGGYDLEFTTRNLQGSAWCDDLKVEKIRIASPWYSHFETDAQGWELYLREGNESVGKITRAPEGFGDKGSLEVTVSEGVAGVAASRTLPRSAFEGSTRWTLTAIGSAGGKGVPCLGVQQLDAAGKPLSDITGKPLGSALLGKAPEEGHWGLLALTFDLHKDTAEVRLLLVNSGPDTARFDNVLLRPAYESEAPPAVSSFPLRAGVYPADAIAAITGSESAITLNAGQTGAVCIFLSGEKREKATTVVEIEVPVWLKLLTAEYPIWGDVTLKWETLPGSDDAHTRYRFTNPYPWEENMVGDMPGSYSGLLLVFDVDTPADTEGEVRLQTRLDDDAGEERRLPVRVRQALKPLERTAEFHVGLWSFLWPNVFDDAAREKLLTTYAAAGFNLGHYRQDRPFVAATFEQHGLAPYANIIPTPDVRDGYAGTPLLTPANAMQSIAGKPVPGHMAIGLALDDPAFRQAYKKRLADLLSGFPEQGGYAFLDPEYWGEAGTLTACFHPSTIEAFRRWAKLPAGEALTPRLILDKHGEQWADFRLWAYGEVLRIARECLRELRPEIQVYCYDYVLNPGGKPPSFIRTAPNSTLHADPHVDGHIVSTYNREGAAFIDALENTVPYLKHPVWAIPFVMKEMGLLHNKNYNYWQISAREYRFETLAAVAYGAKGFSGYPGQLLDADYLLALHAGLSDAHKYEAFYFHGKRDDAAVTLTEPPASVRHTVHRSGERRLLTLFNGSDSPVTAKWQFTSEEKTTKIEGRSYVQIEL